MTSHTVERGAKDGGKSQPCGCRLALEGEYHDHMLRLLAGPLTMAQVFDLLTSAEECFGSVAERELTDLVVHHWDALPDPVNSYEIARHLEVVVGRGEQLRRNRPSNHYSKPALADAAAAYGTAMREMREAHPEARDALMRLDECVGAYLVAAEEAGPPPEVRAQLAS